MPKIPYELQLTIKQYNSALSDCKDIFLKKTIDYGTSWRILRTSSLTDQLYIKATRIRGIEEGIEQKVAEGPYPEYIGLVNYCIIALIQLDLTEKDSMELAVDEIEKYYDQKVIQARELMIAKNNDYGEAWREMRISSLTDLILMKLLRLKSIEDNDGKTIISEGMDANYLDILNYALFAMIKMNESK